MSYKDILAIKLLRKCKTQHELVELFYYNLPADASGVVTEEFKKLNLSLDKRSIKRKAREESSWGWEQNKNKSKVQGNTRR